MRTLLSFPWTTDTNARFSLVLKQISHPSSSPAKVSTIPIYQKYRQSASELQELSSMMVC